MLIKFGEKVTKLSPFVFVVLLGITVVVKNGVHPIGPLWIDIVRDAANSFPEAVNYMSTSFMPIAVFKVIGSSNLVWWLFHFVLLALWTALGIKKLVTWFPNTWKLSLVLFLASPVWLVLILFIGHYDLYTIVGASLVVFGNRVLVKYAGAVLASLANPEQAIVTSLLLLLLYLGLKEREILLGSLTYLTSSIVVFLLVRVVLSNEAQVQRSEVISGEFERVLKSSVGIWSLLPLSLIGITGILVLLLSNNFYSVKKQAFIFLAVFGVPYLFAFAILDQTRVGVVIAAAPYFMICKLLLNQFEARHQELKSLNFELLGLAAILAILFPTIYFDIDGVLRLPYKELQKVIWP